MEKIAFIGTGVMGKSMAGHLLKAGYELTVYNRTKEKAAELIAQGARWADNPAEAAADADVVISIVGYPSDVEATYLGEKGVLTALKKGGVIIDMTTSSPILWQKIAKAAQEKGIDAIDAPVTGGDLGAKNATLAVLCGGDEKVFEKVKPILDVMGKNIALFGAAGAGQYTKLVNQIAVAATMLSITESLIFAEKAGLDTKLVYDTIGGGAASSWSMVNLLPRVLRGDEAPGFMVKHMVKDLRLALEAAQEMKLELPGLALAEKLYAELEAKGYADKGTQTLIAHYRHQ